MTAIALQTLSFSTNLLEKFWKGFVTFLAKTMLGYQMARQMQANSHVASLLKHEYPGMTVEQITDQLNRKTLEMYKTKYAE